MPGMGVTLLNKPYIRHRTYAYNTVWKKSIIYTVIYTVIHEYPKQEFK